MDSPSCLSSIHSALNPGNALVIQARAVPLLIGAAALAALLSIVIEHFETTNASVRAQVIELRYLAGQRSVVCISGIRDGER